MAALYREVRMVARMVVALGLAALLAGCGIPRAEVRSGLVSAGLPRPMASCMAHRMVKRLSLGQLRRLGDLPNAHGDQDIDEFLHHVRALGDPEILGVTTSSAALCGAGIVHG
jgi:hypothetical protein